MILLFGFSFLAGIVTILSPCILPILPIVLSGSVGGSKKKPLGIILGFVVSFTFFTLFLTKIVQLTGIPSDTLRIIATIILVLFGISLFTPKFQIVMEQLFTKLSSLAPQANPNAGVAGGFVIGLTIGIIWAPCVGPIMASVIALAATSKVTTATFFITLAYAIGSGIPMLLIMIGGRNLLNRVPKLLSNTEHIQKGFGVLMIIFACAIFFHWDTSFESFIANSQYGINLTNIENNPVVRNELNALNGNAINNTTGTNDIFNTTSPAPDFVGINHWLNTDKPITLKDLRGKVVLVDFWTYTCINCIRTLPHVTSWYDKYHKNGFVVIGVHTPEFQFEHETTNVEQAIKMYKIHYPVAQDNDYATWQNYNNEYWPAEYLIDATGTIRRVHFGEGEYDKMELAIQTLLKEAGKTVSNKLDSMPDTTPKEEISPETYLNAARMEYYYPTGNTGIVTKNFDLQNPALNSFSLGGMWNITQENASTGNNAVLVYNFTADKVFLVLRPPMKGKGTIKVFLDGKPITINAGTDVKDSMVTVDTDRLYNLVDFHGHAGQHVLRLEFQTPGTSAFAFTFG